MPEGLTAPGGPGVWWCGCPGLPAAQPERDHHGQGQHGATLLPRLHQACQDIFLDAKELNNNLYPPLL